MHYFLTYERVLHSAQVWCVDVSLLIRSIRYWIFFILSSSSIHVSFSAQEKEELLAQQPSTSSEQDDSNGHPNAEESPVWSPWEPPTISRQKAENNRLRSGYRKPASSLEAVSSSREELFYPDYPERLERE